MSRTGRSARLYAHEAAPRLVVHASDLARRGLSDGQLARVSSRRGSIVLPIQSSDEVQPGQAFAAMHWGAQSLSHAGINELMQAAIDPTSKQPELKHAAIRIEAADLPWRLVALRATEHTDNADEQILQYRKRIAPLLARFDYAALTLTGRDHPLLMLNIASAKPHSDALIESLRNALELKLDTITAYHDSSRHITKYADINSTNGHLKSILFAGETAATDWLRELMQANQALGQSLRWLFAPIARPPTAMPSSGRTICNCFGVSETQIKDILNLGANLSELQSKLQCGTSCGSCLPELRRMVGDARGEQTLVMAT